MSLVLGCCEFRCDYKLKQIMLCFKHIYLIYNSIFSKGLLCLFLLVCCLRIFCGLVSKWILSARLVQIICILM